MPTSNRDPLLTTVHIVIGLCMALALFVGILLLVISPVIMIAHQQVAQQVATQTGQPAGWWEIIAITLILALAAVMAGVAYHWLRELRRLIDSVADGDPFVPENADRLARMGWLTVAIEVLSIPVGGIGEWLAHTIKDATSDFGISLGGVLLALVLFVLARVFREGARMRSDLEGTV